MESANSNDYDFDDSGWGYCTEEQLEELLFRNLECLYREAISKILSLGYNEDVAWKSVVWNGHCFGSMDVMTNIMHNAMTYIHKTGSAEEEEPVSVVQEEDGDVTGDDDDEVEDVGAGGGDCGRKNENYNGDGGVNVGNLGKPKSVFSNLRELVLYTMEGMIRLLQQLRTEFSRGDAMWCLLMSDLHVGRASNMQIPILPPDNVSRAEASGAHALNGPCRIPGNYVHAGSEISAGGLEYDPASLNLSPVLNSDFEFVKRFNLPPQLEVQLKRNVAIFAAGFQASSKAAGQLRALSQGCSSSSCGDSCPDVAVGSTAQVDKAKVSSRNTDIMNTIIGSLGNMTIGEKLADSIDLKNEIFNNLDHQIAELEVQLDERKEWAFQKAMQAARRLSSDLNELKLLRMEREETLRLKKGKQALEESTMKRLSEMENALRKASGQVDRANAAVRRLETENAEIRAEMEASKLSASESAATCLAVAKRAKKRNKKRAALEKQKEKLQEEVAEEKKKIVQLQQHLEAIGQAQKEAEMRWKQEQKDKERAIINLEEQKRSKEVAESSFKRTQEMRHKMETDIQRYRDDILRLEEELARLKASAESSLPNVPSSALGGKRELDASRIHWEPSSRMLNAIRDHLESSQNEVGHWRKCISCRKEEISVVFLPCAHQVLCVRCNEDHKAARNSCPCCGIQIEERIRVYGATS